jgi:peptidoglycan/LPS O-acetylase OafA/YrhL
VRPEAAAVTAPMPKIPGLDASASEVTASLDVSAITAPKDPPKAAAPKPAPSRPEAPKSEAPKSGTPKSGTPKSGTPKSGTPKSERFALDGYRAVAAMAVLTFHAYQYNRQRYWPLEGTVWHDALMYTDLAVDMFFVLSGLLLGLPYARSALGKSAPRSARMFLLRRFARLMPLYLTVVFLVWAITNPELPGDTRDLLLHLTFTHVYSDDRIFYTNGPAWTLACEIHYFVLLAILGTLAQYWCRQRKSQAVRYLAMLSGVAVLIGLSIGYRAWAAFVMHWPADKWSAWFNPLAKLDVFAIGLLLGIIAASGVKVRMRIGRIALVAAGAGFVGLSILAHPSEHGVSIFQHTFAGLACAMVLASSTLAPRQPRWLGSRPVVFLGTISYGIYLWQEPVQRMLGHNGLLPPKQGGPMFLIAALIVFVVTVAVAWVSYRVIERTGARIMSCFDSAGQSRDYYPEPGPPPLPLPASR